MCVKLRSARRSASVSRGTEGCGLEGDLMAQIEVGLGLGGCGLKSKESSPNFYGLQEMEWRQCHFFMENGGNALNRQVN